MSSVESAKQLLLNAVNIIAKEYNITHEVAFNRWVCENVLGITDEDKIKEVLSIAGSNDYGVDFFYHTDVGDKDSEIVYWGQVKFSATLDHLVTIEEITKFGDTLRYLTEKPELSNPVFQRKSDLFNSLGGKNAQCNKKMIFVVTGNLNEQAEKEIKKRKKPQVLP